MSTDLCSEKVENRRILENLSLNPSETNTFAFTTLPSSTIHPPFHPAVLGSNSYLSAAIMSSEAGPSNPAPLFKKRGKSNTTSRISQAVIDDQPTPSSTNDPDSTLATSSSLASSAISATSKDEHAQHEEEHEISVQDLIALRSLTRKPTGIELERLNKGERQKKKKNKQKEKSAAQQEEERWEQQMKNGGLMANGASRRGADGGEEEDSEEELDPDKPRRLVRKNNFQGETGTVDVDKHM